jgi:hypothetical protein
MKPGLDELESERSYRVGRVVTGYVQLKPGPLRIHFAARGNQPGIGLYQPHTLFIHPLT